MQFDRKKHLLLDTIILKIQNVTNEDDGDISCQLYYFDSMFIMHIYVETYNLLLNCVF